jgi:RNA polymerase sigma factor (sigma-70 family)
MNTTAKHAQKFFEGIYRDNYAWLYHWLFRQLKQPHQAEDVAQDTFVKLLSIELESVQYPKSFLAKIATRIVIDQARRKQIEQAYLEYLSLQHQQQDMASPESIVLAVELFARIVHMLQGLEPMAQQVFLMSYIDQLSQEQIAIQLHLTRRQVQYALIKALAHCDCILSAD